MRFDKLEIHEYITGTMNDYQVTHTFLNVVVTYTELRQATASCNGVVVAQMRTYDDDPIIIEADALIIDGIVIQPAAAYDDDITYWKLT